MSDHEQLVERIRSLPDRPGIYIFRDAEGKVLYVGKAKSLRKRASSYLVRDHEPRLAAMVSEAVDLEYVVTDSEAEALLLENNWIKNKRPRYNVLLRDDKTYPYLKLTMRDEFPRIAFTRRISNDGGEYFGPDGLAGTRGYPTPVSAAKQARDPELAGRLWKVSEELTGVGYSSLGGY